MAVPFTFDDAVGVVVVEAITELAVVELVVALVPPAVVVGELAFDSATPWVNGLCNATTPAKPAAVAPNTMTDLFISTSYQMLYASW